MMEARVGVMRVRQPGRTGAGPGTKTPPTARARARARTAEGQVREPARAEQAHSTGTEGLARLTGQW